MSGNRSLRRQEARCLKVAWGEQEKKHPVAVVVALNSGDQIRNCDLPDLGSRPPCGQRASKKVDLTLRHLQPIPA